MPIHLSNKSGGKFRETIQNFVFKETMSYQKDDYKDSSKTLLTEQERAYVA
jgi:hypothetical protein